MSRRSHVARDARRLSVQARALKRAANTIGLLVTRLDSARKQIERLEAALVAAQENKKGNDT